MGTREAIELLEKEPFMVRLIAERERAVIVAARELVRKGCAYGVNTRLHEKLEEAVDALERVETTIPKR